MADRAWPPVRPPLAFVDDLDQPALTGDDHHHLARVLRVREGDAITIADGDGQWRAATFGDRLVATSSRQEEPNPSPPITVAFALVKGDRPEFVVQKLTELGADRIIPFVAARSVVRWDAAKADRNLTRLRRVAREAAMQSRRTRLPVIEPVATFATVAQLPGVCRADFGGGSPSLDHPVVAIGPEGGWADEERAAVEHSITLSTHVLRAETAAIAACVLLSALRTGSAPL